MQILAIISTTALLFAISEACTTTDSGAGTVYTLPVTQDVRLEGNSNKNDDEFISVGTRPGTPRQRSLLQFDSLPAGCTRIHWAKMYVYFLYAHKPSSQSVQSVPYISRTIRVYQVKQPWNEAQATSVNRLSNTPWEGEYLALDGSDAGPHTMGSETIFTNRPEEDFVEFDITEAMQNWQQGDSNYGVLLRASNEEEEGRDLRFASNANSDTTRHAFVNVLCD